MAKTKKTTSKGLLMTGSFRSAGMTLYMRQGQVVARVSRSRERRCNTLAQFKQRQRVRHAVALWHALRVCDPMFTLHNTAYRGFMSLATRMESVYVIQFQSDASFLMPGIPVSEGSLPPVVQRLALVEGEMALLTDIKADANRRNERLLLYTAEQLVEGRSPRVEFHPVREVARLEMVAVEGRLALKGPDFSNPMMGWALVRVVNDRCSTQTLVTHCTFYQRFTTDKALEEAAKSYHGLTR